jgi:hypothetical protein
MTDVLIAKGPRVSAIMGRSKFGVEWLRQNRPEPSVENEFLEDLILDMQDEGLNVEVRDAREVD